ncbi:uncharacterized protein LOC126266774 [Schistocerca gregaria]|uniref:uncharacterized protein LOC126266774 n=1 Tax=Schistocerca gregaria TaxID=7010 RepID=UPI00211E782A|nr:uncharacterized protein LOC126266774 [Schistocerca gregaria]
MHKFSAELEASGLPPPRPTTPPTDSPQRASLRSPPLPVRSPAPDGRLPPPPPPPPPRSSAVPEPVEAEAAVTPMEVVAPPPPPNIPSSGAQPGQVFHGAFSSPLASNRGHRWRARPGSCAVRPLSCAAPGTLHPPPETVLSDGESFTRGGMCHG